MVPILTRSVPAAMAARTIQGSVTGGWVRRSKTREPQTKTASQPACSASWASFSRVRGSAYSPITGRLIAYRITTHRPPSEGESGHRLTEAVTERPYAGWQIGNLE